MPNDITIIDDRPYDNGAEAGREIGAAGVREETEDLLRDSLLAETLGAMSRASLTRYAMSRLETQPDYVKHPELEDIYPERVEYLRGVAAGADVSLADAATWSYAKYRHEIDSWWTGLNPRKAEGHCSGVLLVGEDGVIGAHSIESLPETPKPRDFKDRKPKPYAGLKQRKTEHASLTLIRPRTGYIADWGVTNEHGVGCVAAVSCSTWLDERIEDTWPIGPVPLLRFARDIGDLAELYQRYTLHNWGRASQIWADVHGGAAVIEKSFRRIGVRRLQPGRRAIWCTEGHFQSDDMHAFIRGKRLEYVEKFDKGLGAGDLQFATDCAVRFTHIGEMCEGDWDSSLEQMRRILCCHDPFPRNVCRHGGPDTDPYDETVTQKSVIHDVTHNRHYIREWQPWKKFCCEAPERVIQYPPRPFGP